MSSAFTASTLRSLIVDQLDAASWFAEACDSALSGHRRRVMERMSRCGDPDAGFVWLRCDPCGVDRVLSTTCKTRVLCPRCGGRRMSSTAVHLVERVLPDAPLRQWVVTFPQPLPRLLGWRPELLQRVLADLARVLESDLRRRTGVQSGKIGMVSFVQNFTSDLRCFVHIHAVLVDGVFAEADGALRFVEAPVPRQSDLQRVAEALAARVARSFARWRSRLEEGEENLPDEVLSRLSGLGEVREGALPQTERVVGRERRWVGHHEGFQVHGGVVAARGDLKGRERLLRYVARPAVSLKRLELASDGRVRIGFRRAWKNGTHSVLLKPEVFLLRLANLVMRPWVNLTRYHGVFAPASPWRSRVVPKARPDAVSRAGGAWIRWRQLRAHVFGVAADSCPLCGAPMRVVQTLQGAGRAGEVLGWIEVFGHRVYEEHQPP